MNEHDEFEVQLKQAMRRVEVRGETTARFIAIAAEVHAEREVPWRQRKNRWAFFLPVQPVWAMSALVVVVGLAVGGHEVREQRQAEAQQRAVAEREFETAAQITDRALEHTRAQLERAGVRPED